MALCVELATEGKQSGSRQGAGLYLKNLFTAKVTNKIISLKFIFYFILFYFKNSRMLKFLAKRWINGINAIPKLKSK
jgi:hypothetical protein